MVIREKDYLEKTKKKYLKGAIIWFLVMIVVFLTGYVLNKTRNNMFTVAAAVLVLPSAQYITKFIGILKFKDPDIEESIQLESIQGHYNIIHSVIVPHKSSTIFFNHIIVSENKIYCFLGSGNESQSKEEFINKSISKGISSSRIVFLNINNKNHIISSIEKDIINHKDKKKLSNNTRIITQMMM